MIADYPRQFSRARIADLIAVTSSNPAVEKLRAILDDNEMAMLLLNPEWRSTIYFIAGRASRRVKIGLTENLLKRLAYFQSFSPDVLEVLGVIHAPMCLEAILQRRFGDSHSHGEWFHRTDELDNFIRVYAETPAVRTAFDYTDFPCMRVSGHRKRKTARTS